MGRRKDSPGKLTRVVSPNRSLHNLLHPDSHRDLLGGTEVVRPLRVVHDLEAKVARVDVRVRKNAVSGEVDEALDLLLLRAGANRRDGQRRMTRQGGRERLTLSDLR